MGFALWVDGDTAWCSGTHEYRPMGAAVIASTHLFSTLDFDGRRRVPPLEPKQFRGLFGSLVGVNAYLRLSRRRDQIRGSRRALAIT